MKLPASIARLPLKLRNLHPAAGHVLDWLAPRMPEIGLFAAVFILCGAILQIIAVNGLHWILLQDRFAADADHQVHAMFLPKRKREIRMAIVGDSLFHASIPEELATQPGVERVVINGYDSEDLEDFLLASTTAQQRFKTRVCHVLAQAMPSFMVRTKALGVPQKDDMIRLQSRIKTNTVGRGIESIFAAIDRWMDLTPAGDPMQAPHGRVPALIGQARWVDPDRENWNLMLRRLENRDGRLILVEDARGTDLGLESKLSAALATTVAETDAEPDYDIDLIGLDDLPALDVPKCGSV